MAATTTTTIPTVSQVLRAAIVATLANGVEAAELARLAGVDIGMLGRFLRGDGLPVSSLDALAAALRLELVPTSSPPAIVAPRSSMGADDPNRWHSRFRSIE